MGLTATKTTRFILLFVVLAFCIGCDQATKGMASQTLKHSPPISLLGNTIRIQYAENRGSFLGFGSQLPERLRFFLLTIMNGVFLLVLTGILLTRWNMGRMKFTACALIAGGGTGNLLDRAAYNGVVIDFLNIGIGPLRTGIFNVADVAITAGLLGLLYTNLWDQKKARPPI